MRGREESCVAMDPLCTVNFVDGQYVLSWVFPGRCSLVGVDNLDA